MREQDFYHSIAYSGDDRIIIQSTCKVCGGHALVSMTDGSAVRWRETHKCPPLGGEVRADVSLSLRPNHDFNPVHTKPKIESEP